MKKFRAVPISDAIKIKEGDKVTIPRGITDPMERQGEEGTILSINKKDDEVVVRFKDGRTGRYQIDVFGKWN